MIKKFSALTTDEKATILISPFMAFIMLSMETEMLTGLLGFFAPPDAVMLMGMVYWSLSLAAVVLTLKLFSFDIFKNWQRGAVFVLLGIFGLMG